MGKASIRRAIAMLAFLIAAVNVPAAICATAGYNYLDASQIDLSVFLPPPPEVGSQQQRADEDQVAAAVSARTPLQLTSARAESTRSVFFFANSIGPNFTAARLPVTAAFFARVGSDVHRLVLGAKDYWQRPRPDGERKKHAAYPSGHAAFAASTAIVLAQLFPGKRDAIFSQARLFAANRILLGLHYPSDIASGWTAGTLAAFVMTHDKRFQHDFLAVKAELRRARLAP